MKHRILLLTVRAAISIGVTAFILVYGKSYFAANGLFSISPTIYALGAYSLLMLVLWASTRTLVRELVANTNNREWKFDKSALDEHKLTSIHKYPFRLTLLVAVVGLIAVILPYLNHDSRTAISTYVVCFGAACVMFVIAVYLFSYRVVVKPNSIRIHTIFKTRDIALTEIREIRVLRTRNGPQIVLLLKNNETDRFGCMLTGFSTLLHELGGSPVPD